MQRLLRTTLLFAIPLSLSGCIHKEFHTTIENGTGKKIYVVVTVSNEPDKPPIHGFVDAGVILNVYQKIADIQSIEYEIDGRKCLVDQVVIKRAARPDIRGTERITLNDCGND
jgi:hypothetical protein